MTKNNNVNGFKMTAKEYNDLQDWGKQFCEQMFGDIFRKLDEKDDLRIEYEKKTKDMFKHIEDRG